MSSNEFDISKLKKKIGKHLENHKAIIHSTRLCRSLGCRCIATTSDFEYSQNPSNPREDDKFKSYKQKQLENDASNICLTLLNFFMLGGDMNRNKHLDQLFQESMNHLDKHRGIEEIMVYVFYPIYTTIFEPLYHELKKASNYSDPFRYNQRIYSGHTQVFFFDENEYTCDSVAQCKDALAALTSTWQKVINVMSFDWKMGFGSMISNFNYLTMMCSNKYWLQTDEKMWAPNNELFNAPCITNNDAKALYNVIQTITEGIYNLPFGGIYINDLIGYLGYSGTFDLSSLKKGQYMYNTRNLHPIHGMDTFRSKISGGKAAYTEGWQQCNYMSTYQNWVKHTSNWEERRDQGKHATRYIVISRVYFV